MNLLVAGGDRVDAGKTTFSTGLLARVGGVGFKPRAGNDYWFDHDDYREAVEEGRLYGKDARRLAEASVGEIEPEAINPTHRLWRPAPGGDSGLIGGSRRQYVLDRIGDDYLVNADADVPESAREHLPLDGATVVDSLDAFNEAMAERHLPALARLRDLIDRMETSVVESYGDIALPIEEVAFDAVAVVEPERARIYDGGRYGKGCSVASGSARDGSLEQRVSDVLELLDARETVRLPPLASAERAEPERVAAAYEPAYDALLSVARD